MSTSYLRQKVTAGVFGAEPGARTAVMMAAALGRSGECGVALVCGNVGAGKVTPRRAVLIFSPGEVGSGSL